MYPLRRLLTLQPLLAMLVPFVVIVLFGAFWLAPQIMKEVETQQVLLGKAIGSQVERYLETSTTVVRANAAITPGKDMLLHDYQGMLDAQLATSESLGSLYAVAPDGHILAVGIQKDYQAHRQDFLSLDISRNPLFLEAMKQGKPLWSQVFLSVFHGELSVAFAMPGHGMVVIGEIDLQRLQKFLKEISTGSELKIMIVDHNGQVIADQDGQYTAQQLNIANIPLVQRSFANDGVTSDRFDFEGRSMVGSMLHIPAINWHVLVAQPVASLYRSRLNSALVVIFAFSLAILSGVAVSMQFTRKLTSRFDALISHAQDLAAGNKGKEWPTSTIAEFNQLSASLNSMAVTLQLQEIGLRESEELQRLILNSTYDGIYGIDTKGACIVANAACVKMLGYNNQEELLGRNMHELIHHSGPDGNPMPVKDCRIYNAYLEGKGVTVSNEVFWRSDGSPIPVEYSSYPIRRDGTITGAVISWRDMTERNRAEEEREKLEQQLLHAQKLESLGVLAGGIAHDFNNILMAIIGNADLALRRLNKESPAVENLHRIENAACQAADLAKQMLAYSGKGKFVVELLDINQLLEDMLHMLEVSISKKAVLRLNLAPNLPTVEADATQMRQIVMNLVINASEAIGDKSGVIAITTGCMDCDNSYLKDVWLQENLNEGLYLYLEIADTGCGMDKETMAKIFDPFFSTKFTGRGLGMAAVLGIVRGHKGAIKVYSEPDKGTTFKILLPASGRPAEIFNNVSDHEQWQGSGTVLLVDDEETVRGIGKEMLQALGFTTITANDGKEAVEIFKTTPGIAFVILDLTMPHMDGEQCFRELRQLDPGVKVIMSSGFSEQEVTQKFVGKGLAGFIQKPYKLSVLKDAIAQMQLPAAKAAQTVKTEQAPTK